MARQNVLTPSSGKTIIINLADIGLAWTTIAEPDDFSVPVQNRATAVLDPLDSNRELLPGELFIGSPVLVCNKTASTRTVSFRVLRENAGGADETFVLVDELPVAGNTTALVTVQGQYLIKYVDRTAGDRLQVQADVGNALDLSGAALLTQHSDHVPDPNAP